MCGISCIYTIHVVTLYLMPLPVDDLYQMQQDFRHTYMGMAMLGLELGLGLDVRRMGLGLGHKNYWP